MQTEDGIGVYRAAGGDVGRIIDAYARGKVDGDYDEKRKLHPPPYDDSLLAPEWHKIILEEKRKSYIFGFESISQFRRWFFDNDLLKEIYDMGVYLYEFEADDFYLGYTQMIARKENLKQIKKYELAELVK